MIMSFYIIKEELFNISNDILNKEYEIFVKNIKLIILLLMIIISKKEQLINYLINLIIIIILCFKYISNESFTLCTQAKTAGHFLNVVINFDETYMKILI